MQITSSQTVCFFLDDIYLVTGSNNELMISPAITDKRKVSINRLTTKQRFTRTDNSS